MQTQGLESLRKRVLDIPLPSMQTARIFQDGWKAECRGAFEFMQVHHKETDRMAIVNLMIDRALFALERASNNKIRLYAAVGALRFVALQRRRFLEVKQVVEQSFQGNPPDSVRVRLDQVEASMYRKVGE